MRRLGPRPIGPTLEHVRCEVAPATPLARVQGIWGEVVGERVAAEAAPVAERDGVVTVTCRSATWAHELDLMSGELTQRLNGALGPAGEGVSIDSIRFVTRSGGGGW